MKRFATLILLLLLLTPELIAEGKILRIGAITDNAPISYVNDKGAIEGFSIDVTKILMKKIGTNYTIEPLDYASALEKLNSGQIDLLCNAVESEIKLDNYYLSIPYITLDVSIVTRVDEELVKFSDLAGKKIITDSQHLYNDMFTLAGEGYTSNIILLGNTKDGLQALARGEGDCALVVTSSAKNIIQDNNLSNLKIQDSNIEGVKICFASTNHNLIRDINKQIADLEPSGIFEDIENDLLDAGKEQLQSKYIYYGLAFVLALLALSTSTVIILRRKVKKGDQTSTSKILELQENVKVALNAGGISLWKYDAKEEMFVTIEGKTLSGVGLTMEENLSLLHPDDRENQRAIFAKMISGELSQTNATFRYINKNGEYLTYESAMAAIKDPKGEVISIIGSQRDVTEAYEQMRAAKVLSRALPSMRSYSWYIDMRDEILHLNCELNMERNINELTSAEKFIGVMHKDDVQSVKELLYTMLKDERANGILMYRVDLEKIGKYEWWECYINIETKYDEITPYKVILGISINVDERENKSIEFMRLAKQSELVLHNSNSILAYINRDYEVQWSNSMVALNGVAAEKYVHGTKCYKSFGYDSPCPNCHVNEAFEQQKLVTFRFDMHKSGSYLTTAIPVISPDGSVDGIVLRIDNITEQNKLIEELKKAKEYSDKLYSDLTDNNKLLTTVLDEMPHGLFIKDISDDFRYLYASNFFCLNVVQKTHNEIINFTDYDIFPLEAAEKFRHDDLEVITIDSDEVHYIGKERLNVKGKEFVVETFKLVLNLPNGKRLLIGYCTDVTEYERINLSLQESKNRAEQSDKLKSAFLANMSHEIRTPLNAIVGFSDLLIFSEEIQEREEFGKIITNNSKLLLNLINDILDISKIEAGSFTFINELFDVNELCLEMDSIFGMQVKQGVNLIYKPSQELINIMFDKNRFRQILNNFLSNAVKFTPKGQIEFGYEVINGGIKVAVKDTGIGISEENQKKVFSRFAKFDDFAQGTGLGLAICKALVELRGGNIGFESALNEGTTFWFWVPCQIEKVDIKNRIEALGTIRREKDTYKSNILIVEDIESNYMLISAILKEYELTRASDGEQAIELCKRNVYDLVFMDIKMPNINGLEATRAIRKFDKITPIIALTSNAFDSDKAAAMEAGCNDFVTKPVTKQQILNIIKQWLYVES